jgi:predicted DNA-binding transcriptional regulator AlpA
MREITGKDLGLTAVRGRLLEVKEVSAFLRVSDRWIEYHIKDGSFPMTYFPIGERDRRIAVEELNEYLLKIRVSAGDTQLPKKAVEKIKKGEVIA